ncbi:tannase/feruloyl esterase family alpha/beta hydrolase, partial [Streptomyces sp. SID7982]|nr:tannase/feruloyl esterase family alpha/beta hydrolase [Streptomyces sp. SID7982]
WDLTQRIYREELDPGFDGATEAGKPFCAPGTPACDADYAYAERPDEVRDAVAKIALTGRIGKPLISLHGTLDVLLPISRTSDTYVRQQGRGALHRHYRVEGGTHVDSLVDAFPDRLRPLVPCHRSAAAALERWLDDGRRPPSRRTLRLSADATPT